MVSSYEPGGYHHSKGTTLGKCLGTRRDEWRLMALVATESVQAATNRCRGGRRSGFRRGDK